jgi:hypothetical protein
MKLCPQCAFIYEDAQTFCDMDGSELIAESIPVAAEPCAPTRLTINVPSSTGSKRGRLALSTVLMATLLTGLYLAQWQWRQVEAATNEVPPVSIPSTTVSPALQNSEPSNNATAVALDTAATPPDALPPNRLRSISASDLAGNTHAPVLLRLTNGATIRADEVWERKDGVWYRQGSLITFLKHSQVRSIERSATPVRSSVQTRNQPQNVVAQNQPRVVKAEVVQVKKESKVSSFLKKTGRILKKPFRF